MLISTSKGDFQYQSAQEIINHILQNRLKTDEFWISGNNEYPCMAICINGDYASVNYFEDDNGNMWMSFNEDNNKKITFIAGGEEWMPDANAVITLDAAFSCIDEFLSKYERPLCIQWQEL